MESMSNSLVKAGEQTKIKSGKASSIAEVRKQTGRQTKVDHKRKRAEAASKHALIAGESTLYIKTYT